MLIRVLGPVAVNDAGSDVPLGGPRQQAVLGVLSALANEVVSTDRLIDEIWGEDPPPAAKNSLQSMVSNLRRMLEPDVDVAIERSGPGYILVVPRDRIDALGFVEAVDRGRAQLETAPDAAASLLSEALGMWRGTPYAGLDEIPVLQAERIRLEELRIRALGYRIEADLAVGRHGELVGEVDALVSAHPLNEEFARLQMLALYGSGRQSEALRAFSRLRRTLGEELGIDPSPDLVLLEQQILEHDPGIGASGDLSLERSDVVNPYKGLRPFREDDAADFFGRDALVAEVIDRIGAAGPGGFTALVGPSGSGKSSLVSAGVVPRMREGALEGSGSWVIAHMFPGTHPLEELEAALLGAAPRVNAALVEVLRGEGGLRRAARLVAPEGQLLLVIDQAEELFVLASEGERDRFIQALVDGLAAHSPRVRVLLTLRSDFLGAPLLDPRMADLLRAGTLLVPPMGANEIEEAIVGPASRVGAGVDSSLVAAAVADVQGHPGALPMLQYALTEAFERRESDLLQSSDYEAVGGVTRALANTAAAALDRLPAEDADTARQVLVRLVSPGEGSVDTRRRVPLGELTALGVDSGVVQGVVDAFAAARLLVLDVDPVSQEPTVEVAHEALLHEWPDYRRWIDEARDDLRTERRLRLLANEWESGGRTDSYLLRGQHLAAFSGWRDRAGFTIPTVSTEFLDACVAEEQRIDRVRTSRRRRVVGVLVTATLVSLLLALVAVDRSYRSARDARFAEARGLAVQAAVALESDPELALLLALEATSIEPIDEAVEALHRSVVQHRLIVTIPAGGGAATWIDEGRIATLGLDGRIGIYGFPDGDLRQTIPSRGAALVYRDVFDPTGEGPTLVSSADGRLLAASIPGRVVVFDIEDGAQLWALDLGNSEPAIAWHPRLPLLAVRSTSNVSQGGVAAAGAVGAIYDGGSGSPIFELPSCFCSSDLSFDPQGRLWLTLASHARVAQSVTPIVRSADGEWVIDDASRIGVARTHDIAAARFRIVVANETAVKVHTYGGDLVTTFIGHDANVRDVDVGPFQTVVTGGDDAKARVWSATSGTQEVVLAGHTGSVVDVEYSPDAEASRILTVGSEGLARIWDVSPGAGAELGTYEFEDAGGTQEARIIPGTSRIAILRTGEGRFTTDRLPALRGVIGGPLDILDIETGEQRTHISSNVMTFDVHPTTGLIFVSEGFNGTGASELIVTNQDAELTLVSIGSGSSTDVAFDSAGDRLAVGVCTELVVFECRGEGLIRVFEVLDGGHLGEFLGELELGKGVPLEMMFDGDRVVALVVPDPRVASSDNRLVSWRPGDDPVSMAVEPDATAIGAGEGVVVVGDGRGDLSFYRVGDGTLIGRHSAHVGGVTSVAAQAGLVASAGTDGRVQLWDLATGDVGIGLFAGPTSVQMVDFGPQGTEVLALSETGVVTLLTLDVDRLIDIGRSRVTRSLTDEECERYLRSACP